MIAANTCSDPLFPFYPPQHTCGKLVEEIRETGERGRQRERERERERERDRERDREIER